MLVSLVRARIAQAAKKNKTLMIKIPNTLPTMVAEIGTKADLTGDGVDSSKSTVTPVLAILKAVIVRVVGSTT